jgi:hypothetical protein
MADPDARHKLAQGDEQISAGPAEPARCSSGRTRQRPPRGQLCGLDAGRRATATATDLWLFGHGKQLINISLYYFNKVIYQYRMVARAPADRILVLQYFRPCLRRYGRVFLINSRRHTDAGGLTLGCLQRPVIDRWWSVPVLSRRPTVNPVRPGREQR